MKAITYIITTRTCMCVYGERERERRTCLALLRVRKRDEQWLFCLWPFFNLMGWQWQVRFSLKREREKIMLLC